jgi:two-component system phosphate regulon response regulator OmpR
MRPYLEQQGFQLSFARSGAELMTHLSEGGEPDIILLDLMLPDKDGLTLLKEIHIKKFVPVIVVSGRADLTDKVVGLEMGADDYLTKPFEMHELAARIKAVLRRVGADNKPAAEQTDTKTPLEKASRIGFSGWVLDRQQYQLFDAKNEPASLTSGEFKLLEALVLAPNRVLTREKLFDLTREGQFDVYDRVIDTQVARIRKKLDDDPQEPGLIKTVRGVGYMFCGDPKPLD